MTEHYYQPNLAFIVQEVINGMQDRFTSTELIRQLELHANLQHNCHPTWRDLDLLRDRVVRTALPVLVKAKKVATVTTTDPRTKTPIVLITKIHTT